MWVPHCHCYGSMIRPPNDLTPRNVSSWKKSRLLKSDPPVILTWSPDMSDPTSGGSRRKVDPRTAQST